MRSPFKFLQREGGPDVLASAPATPSSPERAPSGGGGSLSPVLGPMLDAIGAVLSATGQYALEAGATPPHEARLVAERWRRHLSTGLGHPGDDAGEAIPRGLGLAERDWAGAAQFVVERRRAEHAHVNQALRDFRDTVWTLVHGLRAVLEEEQLASRQSLDAVERVRAAISVPDSAALRRAALAAVGELSGVLEGREHQRHAQVADLGTRMDRLDVALRDARGGESVDALTRLPVRDALDEAAAHAATLRALWGQRVCLALVAVESLDAVRAAGGPGAADEILLRTATALARVFLRAGDALFRIDDATFAVLIGRTGAADAIPLLERIPTHVDAHPTPTGGGAGCALTVGFAELGAEETAPAWLARAERALAAERERTAPQGTA